jgi:uncharacterized protein (UPF0335 family)
MTEQANNQLTRIVERIEKQEDEISLLKQDVKDIYTEAKGNGYDVKIIRKIIAMRKMDETKRKEESAILAFHCATRSRYRPCGSGPEAAYLSKSPPRCLL